MKKIIKIFALLFALSIVLVQLSACSSGEGNPLAADNFYIQNYDIKIDVASDRVLQIEENITVFYHRANISVGLIRDIPRLKSLSRDGVNHRFIYDVSNISVKTNGANEHFYTAYYGYNEPKEYFSIYIGKDRDYKKPQTAYTYTIKYTYKLGDDSKNYDWFDYVLFDYWSVPIYNASYQLTMPSEFDKSSVFVNAVGHREHKPTIEGNTISGSFVNSDEPTANSFYVDCMVFVGLDYFDKAAVPLSTFLLAIYYIIFALMILAAAAIIYLIVTNSKRPKRLEPCELPPKDMNPMEAYAALKKTATTKQLLPLILYWQNKGLISVKTEGKHLVLTKLKNGDKFMNSFFKNDVFSTADITPLKSSDLRDFLGSEYDSYSPSQRLMLIEQENTARRNRAEAIYNEFKNYRSKICDDINMAKSNKKVFVLGALCAIAPVILMLIWVCIVQRSFLPMFFAVFVIAGSMVSLLPQQMGFKSMFFNPLIIFFISFNAMPLAFVGFIFLPPIEVAWVMYFTAIGILLFYFFARVFITSRSYTNLEICAQILAFKRFLKQSDDATLQRIELKNKGYFGIIYPYLILFNMTNKINAEEGLGSNELASLIRGFNEHNYYYYSMCYIRSYQVHTYHSGGGRSGGGFGGSSGGSSGGHGGGGGRGR